MLNQLQYCLFLGIAKEPHPFDIFYDTNGHPEPLFFHDVAIRDGVLNCEVPENKRMMQSSHIRPPMYSELSSLVYKFNQHEEEATNDQSIE